MSSSSPGGPYVLALMPSLAAEEPLAELLTKRTRLVDPRCDIDARVAARERLRERRGRPHDVDDHGHGRRRRLCRGESNVYAQRGGNLPANYAPGVPEMLR